VARHLDYRNSPAYGAYEVAMMKRSLDLAEETHVELRGVLTWAFTFPDTPYFAGYRALATNGVHLPILNAFKLLGRLRGQRLPVESSGAVFATQGFRDQPDVDALAARDGQRVQVLVWNYHDDLVTAEPASVALEVQLPAGFATRAHVRHERVDDAHGNAYVVWLAQGSPQPPSESQRAELVRAMTDLELEPERDVTIADGRATLSFGLPRFGVSLVTLTPAADPEAARLEPRGGCSVGGPEQGFRASSAWLLLALIWRARRATWASSL
jgi:xylan 1,4-beta-xylosidase